MKNKLNDAVKQGQLLASFSEMSVERMRAILGETLKKIDPDNPKHIEAVQLLVEADGFIKTMGDAVAASTRAARLSLAGVITLLQDGKPIFN